jgi:hypothetical protein
MLFGISGARPGPRPPKRPWRESFAEIRAALRKARRLTGRERTHALVRVCRAFERADGDDAPGWRINRIQNPYAGTPCPPEKRPIRSSRCLRALLVSPSAEAHRVEPFVKDRRLRR